MTPSPPPESDDPVAAAFGLGPSALIGSGGESRVYALDAARVLRVLRKPADPGRLRQNAAFLAALDGRLPYATPVIETIDPLGRYTIERRLPGRSMLEVLPGLAGEDRATAIRNYVLGAEAPAAVRLPDRPFGQILGKRPITAATWHGYLRLSLDRFATENAAAIAGHVGDVGRLRAKALALLDGVPAAPPKLLVHGDYYPGNVLMDEHLTVSGLVDFSFWTVVGDPLLDRFGAAAYLDTVESRPADGALARRLALERAGPALLAAAPFYLAYSAFAMADAGNPDGLYPKLFPWAIENLRALAGGRLADPAYAFPVNSAGSKS